MSGWLGTINYGVITANKIDTFLSNRKKGTPSDVPKKEGPSFAIA